MPKYIHISEVSKEISVHIIVKTCAFTKLVLMIDFQVVTLLVTDYYR